ncbi:MAG: hypothetical protein V4484_18130 [Pseudomonadota bacterium]
MGTSRHIAAFFALLFTAASAVADGHEGDWVSYRDAYRSMVLFEKYGKAKHLIQNQYQVMAKDRSAAPDGLQLSLQGTSTHLNLPLDATGRTVFPLLKAAWDENAALVLNRKAGQYWFRPRISIVPHADGVYEQADLRAACEQALAYQQYAEGMARASRCVGVRFVFARGAADPGVRTRKAQASLPAVDGAAFQGDAYESFRVVNVRFDGADKSPVVTQNAPLAINPVYE